MLEPFGREQSRRSPISQTPRPAKPFIEEDEVDVKTEVKTEATRRTSPLFEPRTSSKRSITDEETPDSKRTKLADVQVSYSGNPLKLYVFPEQLNYLDHEPMAKLEVNSKRHIRNEQNLPRVIRGMVVPTIAPLVGEDDEVKNYHGFFRRHEKIPMPPSMWCSLVGDPGMGKSTLLSHLSGIKGLSSSGNSSEAMTQSPMVFCNTNALANFTIKVTVRYKGSIRSMLRKCFQDLTKWGVLSEEERGEDDNDAIVSEADAAQQYLSRLFPERENLASISEIEDFMSKKGLLAGGDPESILDNLHNDVLGRIHQQDFDWESRSKKMTAESLLDMRNKIKIFTERGELAPIVTSIEIGVHSAFLAQGIKISDLPGIRDTNTYTGETALEGFEACPRTIIVGEIGRCYSKPELLHYLNKAVREKGSGNVWLVLRGREDIEEEPARCTPADKAMLKQLREKLERAQTQASSSSDHEHIREVERLTKVLQMEKLDIRDRLIREHFQKKYPDIRGTGELNVLTISNIDYGKYVNGPDENNPPTLSHNQTGIEKLRDQLCRAPSNARVESLKRHNLLIQQMLRRLKLSFSTAQRPRRDLVVAVFEAHANLPMKKYQNIMNAAAASHKLGIMKLLKTTMVQDIETKIDDKWAKYPAATVASFFKKGGKHKHSIKKVVQKPEFWTAAILLIIDKHVMPLEALLFREVDKCSANIIEAMGNRIGDLVSEIEQLEQAGAVDTKEISEIWYKEKEAFEEEFTIICEQLKEKIKQISIASMIDTGSRLPAFATEMVGVYASAVTEIPPGTSQGAKKRFEYLKKSLFSMTGPLSKMGDEVSGQLKRRFEKWAREVDARIKLTFDNSKDALLNEFKGKRMSPERRVEVAPTIIAAADKALSSLQADLDAYNQDDDE